MEKLSQVSEQQDICKPFEKHPDCPTGPTGLLSSTSLEVGDDDGRAGNICSHESAW